MARPTEAEVRAEPAGARLNEMVALVVYGLLPPRDLPPDRWRAEGPGNVPGADVFVGQDTGVRIPCTEWNLHLYWHTAEGELKWPSWELPKFSEDWAAAGAVLDKMEADGWACSTYHRAGCYRVRFMIPVGPYRSSRVNVECDAAKSLKEGISKAAILARLAEEKQ